MVNSHRNPSDLAKTPVFELASAQPPTGCHAARSSSAGPLGLQMEKIASPCASLEVLSAGVLKLQSVGESPGNCLSMPTSQPRNLRAQAR